MQGQDVRVIERRDELGFAREQCEALRIPRESLVKHLDRDFTLQPFVAGAVNDARSSGADPCDDPVRTELVARMQIDLWFGSGFGRLAGPSGGRRVISHRGQVPDDAENSIMTPSLGRDRTQSKSAGLAIEC